jgi:hypothetical protein
MNNLKNVSSKFDFLIKVTFLVIILLLNNLFNFKNFNIIKFDENDEYAKFLR